tara:strand:+ start:144 stop:428 length:285 start_codon:yes stop_codon:yes gene_type:complete
MKKEKIDRLVEKFVNSQLSPTPQRERMRSRPIFQYFQEWCESENINYRPYIKSLKPFARSLARFCNFVVVNGYAEFNCSIKKPPILLPKEYYNE